MMSRSRSLSGLASPRALLPNMTIWSGSVASTRRLTISPSVASSIETVNMARCCRIIATAANEDESNAGITWRSLPFRSRVIRPRTRLAISAATGGPVLTAASSTIADIDFSDRRFGNQKEAGMAKTQRSLFETGKDNRRPEAGGLLPVSRPDRPLTAAQREFNKLLIKVEELRERLQKETRRLDTALAYYGEHIHPRLKQLASARKAVVRGLAAFLGAGRLKRKKDRETLKEIIAEQLDEVLQDFVPGEDEDLRALFERIHGIDYETLERQ